MLTTLAKDRENNPENQDRMVDSEDSGIVFIVAAMSRLSSHQENEGVMLLSHLSSTIRNVRAIKERLGWEVPDVAVMLLRRFLDWCASDRTNVARHDHRYSAYCDAISGLARDDENRDRIVEKEGVLLVLRFMRTFDDIDDLSRNVAAHLMHHGLRALAMLVRGSFDTVQLIAAEDVRGMELVDAVVRRYPDDEAVQAASQTFYYFVYRRLSIAGVPEPHV